MLFPAGWCCFHELVDARPAVQSDGQCHLVHGNTYSRVYPVVDVRRVDKPDAETQPHGRCIQYRQREFMQETRLMENEYSVNLPTKFVYQGREWNGWINVVNVFRASIVLGTPGSGKSYAVVNNYIKQQIEKSFAMYIYDYKFPDLSEIAYNHLLKHTQNYK